MVAVGLNLSSLNVIHSLVAINTKEIINDIEEILCEAS